MELGREAGCVRFQGQTTRRKWNVVGSAMHSSSQAEAVRERKAEANRVPKPRLDRHHCTAGTQQAARLRETWCERSLERDVVKDQPV